MGDLITDEDLQAFPQRIIEALASMDIVNPLEGLAGNIIHLPQGFVRLIIARERFRPPGEAELLLRRYHIPIWGRWVQGKEFAFTCKRRQARWAEYILRRKNWAVLTVVDARSIETAARYDGQAPPAWADMPSKNRRR